MTDVLPYMAYVRMRVLVWPSAFRIAQRSAFVARVSASACERPGFAEAVRARASSAEMSSVGRGILVFVSFMGPPFGGARVRWNVRGVVWADDTAMCFSAGDISPEGGTRPVFAGSESFSA